MQTFRRYAAKRVNLIPTFQGPLQNFPSGYVNFAISYIVQGNFIVLGTAYQRLFAEDLRSILLQILAYDIKNDMGHQIEVPLTKLAPGEREARFQKLKAALCGHKGPYSARRKYDVWAVRERKPSTTPMIEDPDNNIIKVVIHLKPWHCVAAAVGGSGVIRIGDRTTYDAEADILTLPLSKIDWVLYYQSVAVAALCADAE
jgi:hypothetical protein